MKFRAHYQLAPMDLLARAGNNPRLGAIRALMGTKLRAMHGSASGLVYQ